MAVTINQNQIQPDDAAKRRTGFTNIQNVLQANRPERLSQAVSSGISSTIGQSQQELEKQKQQFATDSQKGATGTDEEKQFASQAIADPTKAAEQGAADRFKRFQEGYKGPQGLGNAQALQAQGQDIAQIGQAAGTAGGRQALLQRFVGGPQYTAGQQRLDSLLLGQAGGGDLKSVRRQALTAQQNINQGQQQAQLQAQQLGQQSEAFKNQLNQQLGQSEQQLGQQLGQRAQDRTAATQSDLDILKRVFAGGGGFSQEDADKAEEAMGRLGLDPNMEVNNALEGHDFSNYITPQAATATGVATASEMQKANALAQLGGKASVYTADQIAAAGEKGAYTSAASVDKAQLKKDAEIRSGEYIAQKNNLDDQIRHMEQQVAADEAYVKQMEPLSMGKAGTVTDKKQQIIANKAYIDKLKKDQISLGGLPKLSQEEYTKQNTDIDDQVKKATEHANALEQTIRQFNPGSNIDSLGNNRTYNGETVSDLRNQRANIEQLKQNKNTLANQFNQQDYQRGTSKQGQTLKDLLAQYRLNPNVNPTVNGFRTGTQEEGVYHTLNKGEAK